MLAPIAETSTYIPPGRTVSFVDRDGARDATVLVNECSRLKARSSDLLTAASALDAWLCAASRAWRIWAASRSVGVGETCWRGGGELVRDGKDGSDGSDGSEDGGGGGGSS